MALGLPHYIILQDLVGWTPINHQFSKEMLIWTLKGDPTRQNFTGWKLPIDGGLNWWQIDSSNMFKSPMNMRLFMEVSLYIGIIMGYMRYKENIGLLAKCKSQYPLYISIIIIFHYWISWGWDETLLVIQHGSGNSARIFNETFVVQSAGISPP